jgi:hypothetical protein
MYLKPFSSMKHLLLSINFYFGPCCECSFSTSSTSEWTKTALDKGYQVFFLDQCDTGLSTNVSAETLEKFEWIT